MKFDFSDDVIQEIEKYLNAGVLRHKIHVTKIPSVYRWSHEKGIVIDKAKDIFKIVKNKDGS